MLNEIFTNCTSYRLKHRKGVFFGCPAVSPIGSPSCNLSQYLTDDPVG